MADPVKPMKSTLSQCGKIQYTVEKNGVKKPW